MNRKSFLALLGGFLGALALVHPKRWAELLRDELARGEGQRWVTTANV